MSGRSEEADGMNDLAALAGGALLSVFYFGTLWLVVRRLDRLAWPALWLGVTGLLRLAVVLLGFVLLLGTRWEQWLAALVGFVAVRVVLTRWLGRPAGTPRDRMVTRGGV